MRIAHILFTGGIVLSGCAGHPNGSVVAPEPPQTTIPVGPITVESAKFVGVTIFPAVSEINVGNTVEFQMRIQLSPLLAAVVNTTVVADENLTVGSTVWLPAESLAPGR